MNLSRFPRYGLRPEALADAVVRVRDRLRPYTGKNPTLDLILVRTDTAVENAYQMFGTMRKNPVTKLVVDADSKRDRLYNNLVRFIEGQQVGPDAEAAAAADIIYSILKKHNLNINHDSYGVESSKLMALFVDLEPDEPKAAIEKLGITSFVAELVAAQNEFVAAYKQFIDVKASQKVTISGDILPALRKCLYQMTTHIAICVDLEPDVWVNVAGELTEIMTEVGAKVKAHKTRIKNREEEEEEEEEENPPPEENPLQPAEEGAEAKNSNGEATAQDSAADIQE